MTPLWILFGLTLWIVASLPIAVLVGRAFAAGDGDGARAAFPAPPLRSTDTALAA